MDIEQHPQNAGRAGLMDARVRCVDCNVSADAAYTPIMMNPTQRLTKVGCRCTFFDSSIMANKIGRPKCDGHMLRTRNRTSSPSVPWTMLTGTLGAVPS